MKPEADTLSSRTSRYSREKENCLCFVLGTMGSILLQSSCLTAFFTNCDPTQPSKPYSTKNESGRQGIVGCISMLLVLHRIKLPVGTACSRLRIQ